MKKEISRNPSFTPSPKLRKHLNGSKQGVTATINEIFDRYLAVVEQDAIRLSPEEQSVLSKYLLGKHIDLTVVQSISQDVIETGYEPLIHKLQNASFGQKMATLIRYGFID